MHSGPHTRGMTMATGSSMSFVVVSFLKPTTQCVDHVERAFQWKEATPPPVKPPGGPSPWPVCMPKHGMVERGTRLISNSCSLCTEVSVCVCVVQVYHCRESSVKLAVADHHRAHLTGKWWQTSFVANYLTEWLWRLCSSHFVVDDNGDKSWEQKSIIAHP